MPKTDDGKALTKFSRQADDPGAVYLYKEGLFVRAYNEGAYGFIHHILACKPLRRFVKSVGEERVVCGVPFSVAAALPGFAQATELDALTWRWSLAMPVDRAEYMVWRESLPLLSSSESASAPAKMLHPAQSVVNQLMQFNLATSTPMAALNLVADLQRQWQAIGQESEVA